MRPLTENQEAILCTALHNPGAAISGRGIKGALKGLEGRGLITFRLATTHGYRVWPTEAARRRGGAD